MCQISIKLPIIINTFRGVVTTLTKSKMEIKVLFVVLAKPPTLLIDLPPVNLF